MDQIIVMLNAIAFLFGFIIFQLSDIIEILSHGDPAYHSIVVCGRVGYLIIFVVCILIPFISMVWHNIHDHDLK